MVCSVKNIRDNVIYLNKQELKIKLLISFLIVNFTVGPKIFCQSSGIPMGSDPAPFLPASYIFMKVIEWTN